jgi:hypothetical protein
MANSNINNSDDIYVKVDVNNLVHIDPGASVDKSGQITTRNVAQENLVTYVNLEADLIPRTTFFADGEKSTLLSIAEGKLNFLRNTDGSDYDTTWSEAFYPKPENQKNGANIGNYDRTSQSFGISSINMSTKGLNGIPDVTINFIDVRGKTLFEAPSNSPYQSFFHLPWPIFYLTIKGYYGKAIRYRLHLVEFSSKFNGNNGNFEITTKFLGSTFTYLNDIKLQNMMVAPYMYLVETANEPYKQNYSTGLVDVTISRTTKGYQVLKSVYDEYKAKKLIPQDFPVKTINELLINAQSAERLLETEIFENTVDFKVLGSIKEFEKIINNFASAINTWGNSYLDLKHPQIIDNVQYFPLNKAASEADKTGNNGQPTLDSITSTVQKGALNQIIELYKTQAETNLAFGKAFDPKLIKDKDITLKQILFDKYLINQYYTLTPELNGKYGVAITVLLDEINLINKEFISQKNSLQDKLEAKMNSILKNSKGGLGFTPTIRNIFAVILASADTYIRLMKDVHSKAIEKSKDRQIKVNGSKLADGSIEGLYPWPQIKKKTNDGTAILMYPGDPDIAGQLDATNPTMWPEIEFIELYESIATKRSDPLTGNDIDLSKLNFVFEDDKSVRDSNNVSTLLNLSDIYPYSDKTMANLVYEIYERIFYMTSYDSFSTLANLNLRDKEVETIKNSLDDDEDLKTQIIAIAKSGSTSYIHTFLQSYSPFERYPYVEEYLPTVDYIKQYVENGDYLIEPYVNLIQKTYSDNGYTDFENELNKYDPEDYRYNIYPFNSNTYQSYLGRALRKEDFKFTGLLSVNARDSFISSQIYPALWVKDNFVDNLFSNSIKLSGLTDTITRNILNTPYFHKQLSNDFYSGGSVGRYAGSAYLLLNSLPFHDLDEVITSDSGSSILMSSMFKEIGSSHFLPYHMILKWGSIYHRYKNYILNGVDIINGSTIPIDGKTYFNDQNSGITFSYSGYSKNSSAVDTYETYISGTTIYSDNTTPNDAVYYQNTIGLYPYYQNVYNQIVNGSLLFYPGQTPSENEKFGDLIVNSNTAAVNFNKAASDGVINFFTRNPNASKGLLVSCYSNNFKINVGDLTYTLLPSYGDNISYNLVEYNNEYEQDAFKIIWSTEDQTNIISAPSTNLPNYSGNSMPSYNQYFKNIADGTYTMSSNNRKVIDLIATFSPSMLDDFEQMFLDFTTLKLTTNAVSKNPYKYSNFQDLLKAISSVSISDVTENDITTFVTAQNKNLTAITKTILSNDNLVKFTIGNPKQIDNYVLYGVSGINPKYLNNINQYSSSQLTQDNLKYIKLYIGEDLEGYYQQYFALMNIEINQENIKAHRQLARIYAGYMASNARENSHFVTTTTAFQSYLKTEIVIPHQTRFLDLFNNLLNKIAKELPPKPRQAVTPTHGYNTEKTTKLETYNFFKEFNDKWIGGNSIGQNPILEDFLFLDRANADIGDQLYLSLTRLVPLGDAKNAKKSLFSIISILINGENIDFRPLPAYVNFYGTNFTNTKKVSSAKDVAKNLFGTFLEVDYQDSQPKMLLQYIGPVSKYLPINQISNKFKYKSDGFNINNITPNPLLISQQQFAAQDYSKSNRVVGFEINFGDQGNSMFKSFTVDQTSKTPTSATFEAYEALGRSASGSNTAEVDVNLYDVYRTYSYTCEVTALGNVMIQPTMYFHLNNIPLFEGTYLIMEVHHEISAGVLNTKFKGVKMPIDKLPQLQDSFIAAYRPLFDKLLNAAFTKKQTATNVPTTIKTYAINGKNTDIDFGTQNITGEELVDNSSGYLNGIPYNGQDGESHVQLVKFNNSQWLRAVVGFMGFDYAIPDNNDMTVLTVKSGKAVKWSHIKGPLTDFYSCRFNFNDTAPQNIKGMKFFNPRNSKVDPIYVENTYDSVKDLYYGAVDNALPQTTDKGVGIGIAMSKSLMLKLKVNTGDVVYFNIN